MTKQVEFLFDFGSPYSYLAYKQLPKVAASRGATILWTPVLLGGIFQATGNHSPIDVPSKGQYSFVDLKRWASSYGVKMTMNPNFPINTLSLMRGAVAMQMRSHEEFERYLDVVFEAMFGKPRNLNLATEVALMLDESGFESATFMALISEATVKEKLKINTQEAVKRGVFGVPTFFVGNEMYWGQDRLHFVDATLNK